VAHPLGAERFNSVIKDRSLQKMGEAIMPTPKACGPSSARDMPLARSEDHQDRYRHEND